MTRLFRRFADTTPLAFLDRLTFNKAIHLLLHTSRSIKEVADALHFRNQFTFSRSFKRVVGHAPSHYRRRHKQPE